VSDRRFGQLLGKNKAKLRQIVERSVNQFHDWLTETALSGTIRQGDLG
jgi:hypothetical protein